MRLENPKLLASSLEDALGEYHWVSKNTDPHMRLRDVGVCGLVSAAIAENIEGAQLRISTPRILGDDFDRHVIALVPYGDQEVVVDASYTQFLVYAGLAPGYVMNGGIDTFPEQKIATFPLGEHRETVLQLARHARVAIDTYERPDVPNFALHGVAFEHLSDDEIVVEYEKIWNPSNLKEFTVPDDGKRRVEAVASFIPPEALRLVD